MHGFGIKMSVEIQRKGNYMTKLSKALVLMSFVVMMAVNALANILPINGITTGEISDSLPSLTQTEYSESRTSHHIQLIFDHGYRTQPAGI